MQEYEIISGGYKLKTARGHFMPGTDTVLLSAYPGLKNGMKICELGCGTGTLLVLLAARSGGVTIDGVEILDGAVSVARGNIKLNRLSDRIRVISGDIRDYRSLAPSGHYDLVISNPPYFQSKSGKQCKTDELKSARSDLNCSIGDICEAASYLTRWGGRFAAVFRPDRLVDLICRLRECSLEPKRLRFIKNFAGNEPSLVLMEARRGGNPGLKIEPDLVLRDPDGKDSEELRNIYLGNEV